MFSWIEFGLTALTVAMAFGFPNLGSGLFKHVERLQSRLAQRPGLAVLTVGIAALVTRAALRPILPIPYPGVHDEFGYLLLADTFAHGRLTNPTHPMWVHFESFHIIWQPTYTAMFYPAQGLMMALGQVVLGHPFWGVWLSVGLMCAAICWMLQGWLPPGWALLGGFLAVIRLGTFSYWANSYWGGAVAATGGALVLGALPRTKRSQRVRDALIMGLGFAVLANSRPYEGLFFSAIVVGAFVHWMFGRDRPSPRLVGKHIILPIGLTLVLTGCAMGYYFWCTTGSPWDTPFLVGMRTYYPASLFPWQPLRPIPSYHHPEMLKLSMELVRDHNRAWSVTGMMKQGLNAIYIFAMFFLGPVLSLPLVVAFASLPYGFSWRSISSSTAFLLLVSGVVLACSLLPSVYWPHYEAPITCAIYCLVLRAMRRLCNRPTGLFIARGVPAICLIVLVLRMGAKPLHLPEPRPWLQGGAPSWCTPTPSVPARGAMLAELQALPGRQLAIVRQGPDHEVHFNEWVYNDADVDRAKVIWARDMGAVGNQHLIDYFHDRRVWLVEPDVTPPRLIPYATPDTGPSSAKEQAETSAPAITGSSHPLRHEPEAGARKD